jgi:hypothetical protein
LFLELKCYAGLRGNSGQIVDPRIINHSVCFDHCRKLLMVCFTYALLTVPSQPSVQLDGIVFVIFEVKVAYRYRSAEKFHAIVGTIQYGYIINCSTRTDRIKRKALYSDSGLMAAPAPMMTK